MLFYMFCKTEEPAMRPNYCGLHELQYDLSKTFLLL